MNGRLRTWLRGNLPAWIGTKIPKIAYCSDHDWYVSSHRVYHCYHCMAVARSEID